MSDIHGTRRVLAALAAVLLAAACGNPFGSSETGSRFTPQIKNLEISRTSVFCNVPFQISFDYSDPQGDYERVELYFIGEDNGGFVVDSIDWGDERLDAVSQSGRVSITYAVDCLLDSPDGTYTLYVTLIDARDHESNELSHEINLR